MVLGGRRMENNVSFLFLLNTDEHQRFWEVEVWKTMTVLVFCLNTYKNQWFWEVEEWNIMIVLLFWLET